MGSVNGNEFLNDPTGSRRFLPFEVESINIKEAQKIDMDLIWAQAFKLFEEKFIYWFNDEEIEELNRRNTEFAMSSTEEEGLQYCFSNKVPEDNFSPLKHFPPSIIQSKLEKRFSSKLSSKKLGDALSKLGFKKTQKGSPPNRQWGWEVYEKSEEEINMQQFL